MAARMDPHSAPLLPPTNEHELEPCPPPPHARIAETGTTASLPDDEPLQFWNGHGGFSADGCEYVIRVVPDAGGRLRLPPQPWTNVVANPHFGFIASETGAGYTWSQNSRENRLTPWYNDPVLDPHGEALYLRDEETSAVWSLQPGPIPQPVAYEVRHGFGYSRYHHVSQDLEQAVCLFVPREEPVKLALIHLRNPSARPRRLSLFTYARLVLGVLPTDYASELAVIQDPSSGALLAENRNRPFTGRIAFAAFRPHRFRRLDRPERYPDPRHRRPRLVYRPSWQPRPTGGTPPRQDAGRPTWRRTRSLFRAPGAAVPRAGRHPGTDLPAR